MKIWGRNKKKRFYSEMWRNVFLGRGACESPVELSMYDVPMETVEYT